MNENELTNGLNEVLKSLKKNNKTSNKNGVPDVDQ